MHGNSSELLLTPQEVGVLLRVAVSTIYSAAAAGRLPCVRIWKGRRKSLLRFRRAEIEALIAGNPSQPSVPNAGRPR